MRSALLVVLALAWGHLASAAEIEPAAAVEAALALHPAVQRAEAELAAARGQRAAAALFLDNPTVDGRIAVDGSRSSVGIRQPLSVTGEGWHARRAASATVEAAEASLGRARLAAAAGVRRAWADAAAAEVRVALAIDGAEVARRLHDTVRRREAQGEASLLEVRLARLSLLEAEVDALRAREQAATAQRELAALTGDGKATAGGDPLAAAPAPAGAEAPPRSDVAAARARVQAAEASLARQRAATVPRIGVGAFAGTEGGERFAGPTLGVELPLFDRNQAGRARARSERAVAEGERARVAARAEAEARTARARQAAAEEVLAGVADDPDQVAREALAGVEAGYRAGELDLAETLLLQSRILDGRAASVSLRREVAHARLDLLLAVEDPRLLGAGR